MNKKSFKEESIQILKGLEKAYERMVEFKKMKKSPLVVSDHGKIKRIPAEDILPTTVYSR